MNKNDFFSAIEYRDISVTILDAHNQVSLSMRSIMVTNDNELLSENDSLYVDWENSTIEERDGGYIIETPNTKIAIDVIQ